MSIRTEQVGPLAVSVHYDDSGADSPRDWDNLGTLSGYSRESTIFDEAPEADAGAAYRAARSAYGPILALPVKVLSQSYTIVQETDDWGYADGIYYVPLAKVAEEYPGLPLAEQLARARTALRAELAVLNAWLAGEVYGFVVAGPGGEHISSCWGFVGDEEYALAEGREAAAWALEGLPAWVRDAWAIRA